MHRLFVALMMVVWLTGASQAGELVIENSNLRLAVDEGSGALVSVYNKLAGLELIKNPRSELAAVQLEFASAETGEPELKASRVRKVVEGTRQRLELAWQESHGFAITAEIELRGEQPEAGLRIEVASNRTAGGKSPGLKSVTYPRLMGLGELSEGGAADRLLWPESTGLLFYDPTHLPALRDEGLWSIYPHGSAGASLQLFAYYAEGKGGFSVATYDSQLTAKAFRFGPEHNTLGAQITHFMWDMRPGAGFKQDYYTVIKPLARGDWYEAADAYRQWAEHQPWCSKGTVKERSQKEGWQWLPEEVGAASFGLSSSRDESAWYEAYSKRAGTRMLHVLGWDWSATDWWSGRPGLEPWLPAEFNEANLTAIKAAGDYWAPFMFDLFSSAPGAAEHYARPKEPPGFDFVCVAEGWWNPFHIERAQELAASYAADGLYYDIGMNEAPWGCEVESHGHVPGRGREFIQSYRELYEKGKQAAREAAGRYVPLGTEMVSEASLGITEFYQARGICEWMGLWELQRFRELLKSDKARQVPLFEYVYHQYAPIRLDGWGRLSKEYGDIFYLIAARCFCEGAVYELNAEFSPTEILPENARLPVTGRTYLKSVYGQEEEWRYELDEEKADFLREIAQGRIKLAKDYLVYGKMAPPVAVEGDIEKIELDYHFYSYLTPSGEKRDKQTPLKTSEAFDESGIYQAAWLVQGVWVSEAGKLGIVLANISEVSRTVGLRVVPNNYAAYGLRKAANYSAKMERRGATVDLGQIAATGGSLEVELPARKVVLVTIAASGQ